MADELREEIADLLGLPVRLRVANASGLPTEVEAVTDQRDPVGTVRELRYGAYEGVIIVKSVLGRVVLGQESHPGSGMLRMLYDHELLPSVVVGTVPGMDSSPAKEVEQ